jgi:hypothetical protein
MSDSDEQTAGEQDVQDVQDVQALRLAFLRGLAYVEAEARKPVQDAYLRHANATQAYLTLSWLLDNTPALRGEQAGTEL